MNGYPFLLIQEKEAVEEIKRNESMQGFNEKTYISLMRKIIITLRYIDRKC